jgi:hexaprenyl-diphosphate synthase
MWVSSNTPNNHKYNGINGSYHHHQHQQQQDHLDHLSSRITADAADSDRHSDGRDDARSGVNDPITTSWDEGDLYIKTTTTSLHRHDPQSILQIPSNLHSMTLADPFVLAQSELATLSQTIRDDLLGTDHPVLNQAASYFFNQDHAGGKQIRPMMVLLLSRALADAMMCETTTTTAAATNSYSSSSLSSSPSPSLFTTPLDWQRSDLPQAQRRLAEISEIIHTASLFHDDVIDGADTRRGFPALHKVFGNKMAILAGDYLLARASISLARLRHVEVIESMSTIIEHLVRGEVMQLKGVSTTPSTTTLSNDTSTTSPAPSLAESRLQYYLRKNFYKTGSLMANSCKSTALLGNYPLDLVQASYRYGKHIGMAFQLVDDILDFEGSTALMGKPALSDLKAGIATAPVLFALEEEDEEEAASHGGGKHFFSSSTTTTSLHTLVQRKFRQEGDVERAVDIVMAGQGIERTKHLAQAHAQLAIQAAMDISSPQHNDGANTTTVNSNSIHRDALIYLAYKVINRTK